MTWLHISLHIILPTRPPPNGRNGRKWHWNSHCWNSAPLPTPCERLQGWRWQNWFLHIIANTILRSLLLLLCNLIQIWEISSNIFQKNLPKFFKHFFQNFLNISSKIFQISSPNSHPPGTTLYPAFLSSGWWDRSLSQKYWDCQVGRQTFDHFFQSGGHSQYHWQ